MKRPLLPLLFSFLLTASALFSNAQSPEDQIKIIAPANACLGNGEVQPISSASTVFTWETGQEFEAFEVVFYPNPCGAYPEPADGELISPDLQADSILPPVVNEFGGYGPASSMVFHTSGLQRLEPEESETPGIKRYNLPLKLPLAGGNESFIFQVYGYYTRPSGVAPGVFSAPACAFLSGGINPGSNELPCLPPPNQCLATAKKKNGPGISGGYTGPTGKFTQAIGDPLILEAEASDVDMVVLGCTSLGCGDDFASRQEPLNGRVSIIWKTEKGDAPFKSSTSIGEPGQRLVFGEKAMLVTDLIAIGESKRYLLTLVLSDGHSVAPRDAPVFQKIKIKISRTRAAPTQYQYEVTKLSPNTPVIPVVVKDLTKGVCSTPTLTKSQKTDLQPPVVILPSHLRSNRFVPGVKYILYASHPTEYDRYAISCAATDNCGGSNAGFLFEDDLTFSWSIVGGGGKFIKGSVGRSVVFEADANATTVNIKVEVSNRNGVMVEDNRKSTTEVFTIVQPPVLYTVFGVPLLDLLDNGIVLCKNINDSNANEVTDINDRTPINVRDPDLIPVRINPGPGQADVVMNIIGDASRIKVWSSPTKQKLIPSGVILKGTQGPVIVFIEGVKKSAAGVKDVSLQFVSGALIENLAITVYDLVKLPLGRSIELDDANNTCVKVYVPDNYGGFLTIKTSQGSIGKIRNPLGELFVNGTNTGHPRHGWYTFSVRSEGKTTLSNTFVQKAIATDIPWNFWYFPYKGDNDGIADLYEKDGAFAKFDKQFKLEGDKSLMKYEFENHHASGTQELEDWVGHCEGFVFAGILYDQPQAQGDYTQYEVEALLADYYCKRKVSGERLSPQKMAYFPTKEPNELADKRVSIFHHYMVKMLMIRDQAFHIDLADFAGDDPVSVWNQACFKFKATLVEDKEAAGGEWTEKILQINVKNRYVCNDDFSEDLDGEGGKDPVLNPNGRRDQNAEYLLIYASNGFGTNQAVRGRKQNWISNQLTHTYDDDKAQNVFIPRCVTDPTMLKILSTTQGYIRGGGNPRIINEQLFQLTFKLR